MGLQEAFSGVRRSKGKFLASESERRFKHDESIFTIGGIGGFPARLPHDSVSALIRLGAFNGIAVFPGRAAAAGQRFLHYKALGRRRATGETTARLSGRGPASKLAAHDEALRERIADEPDATIEEEIRSWLLATHDMKVSIGCLWKRLRHLDLTFKKVTESCGARSGRCRPSACELPGSQAKLSPEHLVFIDESVASTKMTRLYGRCARGERLVCTGPHGLEKQPPSLERSVKTA